MKENESFCYTARIRLRNSFPHVVQLWVEPWGDLISMPSDATYELISNGPSEGCLEIDVKDGVITAYGWSGSTLAIFHEGVLLHDYRIRPPAIPANRQ
jgi:hypothetical protein